MLAFLKRIPLVLRVILCALLVVLVAVGGYVAYMLATYNRIPDKQQLEVENNQGAQLKVGEEYSALSYNIGFGAYTPEFTFFMDTGEMLDGTKTTGSSSWAASKESVESCTEYDIQVLREQDPSFVLLQEVDFGSTRSYGVDQRALITQAFPTMGSSFAVNYHSSFLFYPLTQPHGFANSGLLTLSSAQVKSAERRSYPVSQSLSKYFDLDRCFAVSRVPVEGGAELVLINNHMSAYDQGGVVREQQLQMLRSVMEEEAAKGNYVIVGGDFNHAFCGSEQLFTGQQKTPSWLSVLGEGDIPEGFQIVCPSNLSQVASCRDSDIPYAKGVTFECTVDGFIVSSSVEASSRVIDCGYTASDHNPVRLEFTLKARN
ncbi:MAG: endonuclease/exonuclease/phosphatase family protein [Coriobacteriales bacterium]